MWPKVSVVSHAVELCYNHSVINITNAYKFNTCNFISGFRCLIHSHHSYSQGGAILLTKRKCKNIPQMEKNSIQMINWD